MDHQAILIITVTILSWFAGFTAARAYYLRRIRSLRAQIPRERFRIF